MGVAVRAVNWRPTFGEPLSFAFTPGERVLLRGPSGAGKSTLLAALAGVGEGEYSGELTIDGYAPHEYPSRSARARTGLVLQDPFAQAVMSRVGDDIAFGLENLGVPAAEMPSRIAEALDAVGLNVSLDHPTDQLSGGERQRLALAGVLAMRPSLLLLDEPTASLDPQGAMLVREAVARVVSEQHITLIVVDHTPGFWSAIVNREIEMGVGRSGRHGDGGQRRVRASTAPAPAPVPAPSDSPVLIARDLAVGYPGGRVVQSDLNVEIERGSILAVTGPNGSGKSALALTLGGLIPARAGTVALTGKVGSVFQAPEHQFVGHTVRADISAGVRKLSDAASRVDDALRDFDLSLHAERNPFTLSGGEKRRLSIADVVVMHPEILILDEPTSGLDNDAWLDLVASLARLRDNGHAIVVVSHDERFVDALADRRLVLA